MTACTCTLSPVFTVPVLPRFAPVKESRFTGVNRGIFSKQNDFVLTVPVLPRCSYGFRNEGTTVLPGFTPDSSRCMPVRPGSTTVRPGVAPVVHGDVPVTAGRVTVCAGGVPVLHRFATVRPGLHRFVGQSIISSANAATMTSHT